MTQYIATYKNIPHLVRGENKLNIIRQLLMKFPETVDIVGYGIFSRPYTLMDTIGFEFDISINPGMMTDFMRSRGVVVSRSCRITYGDRVITIAVMEYPMTAGPTTFFVWHYFTDRDPNWISFRSEFGGDFSDVDLKLMMMDYLEWQMRNNHQMFMKFLESNADAILDEMKINLTHMNSLDGMERVLGSEHK